MTQHYMAIISKKFSEATIHYNVVEHGLSFSVNIDEYLKMVVAAIPLKTFKWYQRVPVTTKEELQRMVLEAMEVVNSEIKNASIHQPPPMQVTNGQS